MSKIKTLITALVLGSSSVAMAAPGITAPNLRDHRPVDTNHRWFGWVGGVRSAWVSLAAPMQLDRGRQVIRVQGAPQFNQLRIESKSGSSRISRVTVVYTDGSRQIVRLDEQIGPRNRQVQFAVTGGRAIASLIIQGSSGPRGTYQVFGLGASSRRSSAR